MNKLVTIHNDLVDLPLKHFTASEIDILNSICYSVRNKKQNEVIIPFADLKELSDYKNKNNAHFIESVEATNRKLMALNFKIGPEEDFIQFVLFPTFRVNSIDQELTVKVNEPFEYLLNNISGNYTSFELEQSSRLKSSYTKQIFKKLQEYKYNGLWVVTLDNFKEYLSIPKSFSTSKIDERIIRPAIKELEYIFKDLKCDKVFKKSSSGKGRPSVDGYRFTFEKFKKNSPDAVKDYSPEDIATITNWSKTSFYCPKCKKPIFSKYLENENGTYILYGHPDFRTGPCEYTCNDSEYLLREYQIKSSASQTEEQKKNVNILKEMMSKLFKR